MSLAQEYRAGRYQPDDISGMQTPLATSLWIPFIESSHCRWNYILAVVVSSEPDTLLRRDGAMPTDDELRAIASFEDAYCRKWLNERFRALMRQFAPYDIDGGANFAFLRKNPETGGWHYRKRTWQFPPYWPRPDAAPLSLVQVMDRVNSDGDGRPYGEWTDWKRDHAAVFEAIA